MKPLHCKGFVVLGPLQTHSTVWAGTPFFWAGSNTLGRKWAGTISLLPLHCDLDTNTHANYLALVS
jgi:hypothetical protein